MLLRNIKYFVVYVPAFVCVNAITCVRLVFDFAECVTSDFRKMY
jgi:hypothetical protein